MPERFVSSRSCRCAQKVFTCVSTAMGQVAQSYWLITILFLSGRDISTSLLRYGFGKLPQKQLRIRNQPSRLKASPVRQLRDNGWVDIHDDSAYGGGKQIARGDSVQHRGDHDSHLDAGQSLAHALLSLLHVINDTGHGAIVTNRACKDHGNIVLSSLVGDALFEQASFNCFLNGTQGAYGVDGAEVVAVTAFDLLAAA